MKKIVVGADHGGFKLKEALKLLLLHKGYSVKDVGTYSQERCDYPVTAYAAAKEVSTGRYPRAVIICKSGIGNSIVANKLPRVRAALCYNVKAARLSRQHNDSNVLVLGSMFVNAQQARRILAIWLSTEFEGGRHEKRIRQIRAIEEGIRCGKK
ncbi:MAG: ribose 5-phosphate isomerase B [Candidatus Omnitrophota bacterium]